MSSLSGWLYLFPGRWLHYFVFALTLGLLTLTPSVRAEVGASYTLGVVPQYAQRKVFAIWMPIVNELNRRTGLNIRLEATLTIPEFEAGIDNGAYDFVYANPYHILRVSDSQGYIPLLRDSEPLRGILLVRQDSPIKKVKELSGKILAVPSPNAVGASMLLRADLEHLYGVQMSMMNVRTHSSVYLNVLNQLADAGGGVQKTLAEQDPEIQKGLRILYTTRGIPSHPLAAHPRVKADIRKLVRNAMLEMSATPDGKALLNEIPMPMPVRASLDDYRVMRKWGLENYWVNNEK